MDNFFIFIVMVMGFNVVLLIGAGVIELADRLSKRVKKNRRAF